VGARGTGRDPERLVGSRHCSLSIIQYNVLYCRLVGSRHCSPSIIQYNVMYRTAAVLQVHRSEGLIYMVLEFGDIDLAHLLQVGWVRCSGCLLRGGCCIAAGVPAGVQLSASRQLC
jgi:hypothetical protein